MKRIVRGLILVAVVLGLSGCGYNTMQTMEEQVFRAWGDLEAQLQRRADLIPNLVATVRGYADHEQETLQAVTDARSRVGSIQLTPETLNDPQAMENFRAAQGELSSALSRLMVVTENYPNLKADQSFRDLQNQLEGTENRISVARQRYNEQVQKFNSTIRSFPNSLTNSILLKLERKEYFEAAPGSDVAPTVQF
ncbi:LemA family protein [Spirochaeta lutea]|uniref:Lipoprotein n=1 Tax=Spirochaeta lutea TaxID=1480694 RepID=A0A098QWD0_9SPIO|nr:LemA family protein [Spirochaeta lutea]KGE72024.1 lipoprotein [Spirochaeta lutea]